MAFDKDIADLLRADLAGHQVAEQKMFGGLAFMLNGHMVCGMHKGGAMFRVGKERTAAALAVGACAGGGRGAAAQGSQARQRLIERREFAQGRRPLCPPMTAPRSR